MNELTELIESIDSQLYLNLILISDRKNKNQNRNLQIKVFN
jgi:hypothetical protein